MPTTKRFTLTILLAALLSVSCIHLNEQADNDVSIDLKKSITNEEFQNHVSDIRLIPLELNDSSLVGHCKKVIIADDIIYIFDSKQQVVVLFDIDGKFLRKIDRRGRSGQEYTSIEDIFVYDGLIGVFDNNKLQIIFYDADANYVKTISVTGGINADVTASGEYVIYSHSIEDHVLNIFDDTGNSLFHGFQFPKEVLNLPSMFSPNKPLTIYGDEIYFTNHFDPSIYTINDGKIEKLYRFDFKPYNMPDDLLRKGSPVEVHSRIEDDKNVKALEYLTVSPEWITFEAYYDKYKCRVIYYNRTNGTYFTDNGLKSPFSVLFNRAPYGISSDGYYYSVVSAANISGGIVPIVEYDKEQYEFLKAVSPDNVSEEDNPWIVLFKLE